MKQFGYSLTFFTLLLLFNESILFYFQFTGSLRKFVNNGLDNFAAVTGDERPISNTNNNRKNLRVSIKPSMLRAKEFKIKNERS